MELNICHLYPDLLNVYGDVGNILILKHRAEERGIKVNIINGIDGGTGGNFETATSEDIQSILGNGW